MQTANAILEVYDARGKGGKTLSRIYRQLFNAEVYQLAYAQIYSNHGATTRGVDEITLDGMSKARIDRIIQKVKKETYVWSPVRRTEIPKGNGKTRPLGIPTGDDKVLQAAMKMLLEAYYEPQFSEMSHGYRPGRGCHTALTQITRKHQAVTWFIEGDIQGCFDNIDHGILIGILAEKIEDGRFLRLLSNCLKAGYMENWTRYETLSGTPQGGIISPLLANIYMDVFDQWVENDLMPRYNRGAGQNGGKRPNPEYRSLANQITKAEKRGDVEAAKELRKRRNKVPSLMVDDEKHRKLRYVRYADDFLLSFAGPKSEAKAIKEEVRNFLNQKLRLQLSEEKTLITHARTEKAHFLGYDIKVMYSAERRTVNGHLWFGVPREVVVNSARKYSRKEKPVHRPELLGDSDYTIITTYQQEWRGLVQYYTMAHNIHKLSKVMYMARGSLLKTLAAKHKRSVRKTVKKFASTEYVKGRAYKVLRATVAREGKKPLDTYFGAIPLARNPLPTKITDHGGTRTYNPRNETVNRMLANQCEMCGQEGPVEMHHVRGLKDLNKPGRKTKLAWQVRQAALRRKTMATCHRCHRAIHAGTHLREWDLYRNTLESRVN